MSKLPLNLPVRPMTPVILLSTETPITDMLHGVTKTEPLMTWNGSRTPKNRRTGGEWDTLRDIPLATRRRLTSARYMSRNGMEPDVFCMLLEEYGGTKVGPDPIAWFVRTAIRALDERQAARRRARETALARSTGHEGLFSHRDKLARDAGFRSYYHYRMHSGWGDGHGRGLD